MTSTFEVSTTKCMTCNNEVLKTLGTLQGVFGATMHNSEGRIVVSHTDEVTRSEISALLLSLGLTQTEEDLQHDEPSIWGCAL